MKLLSRIVIVAVLIVLQAHAGAVERKPIWLLGNGFHTSLVLRARDIPYRRDITATRGADYLAIGFGAWDDYRGPSNTWTLIEAIFPGRGILQVVPVKGPIPKRFPHSDVVELWLDPAGFAKLLAEVDRSFSRGPGGGRVYVQPGYDAGSRFYASTEHFYFPYVCNEWVAIESRARGPGFA